LALVAAFAPPSPPQGLLERIRRKKVPAVLVTTSKGAVGNRHPARALKRLIEGSEKT
jgi:hypothetical protein